jgi:hypothetical protein
MSCVQYQLADYDRIAASTVFAEYLLSKEVQDVIHTLSRLFGVSMDKKQKERAPRRQSPFEKEVPEFNPGFKQTVIEKKSGVELLMNDIRISLNKISEKNYETHHAIIISKIREIQESQVEEGTSKESPEESICKIATIIFEIASTNKFFSEIYARLYKSLLEVFPEFFVNILKDFIEGFADKMTAIRYVDQSKNYDEFCNYNKENDKRKASAVFITNLVKSGVVSMDTVKSVVVSIQRIVDATVMEEDKGNEVDEIVENLFLLLTSNPDILRAIQDCVKPRVEEIAGMKARGLPSLSSRCIFKYRDILDKMRK